MGGSFILAINIALGAAIMLTFLAFGLHDRGQRAPLWWFAACLFGVLSGAIEYALPSLQSTGFARLMIFSAFAISSACLAAGLALRYRGMLPWRLLFSVVAVAVACYLSVAELPRTSLTRAIMYQLPYAGLQAIGLSFVLRGRRSNRQGPRRLDLVDKLVVFALAFSILQFLVKPFVMVWLGGNGTVAQDYLGTDYAMASQTMMAISTILLAFTLGARLFSDMFSKLQVRSEIDTLSGLLNRSGFERLLELLLATRGRGSPPLGLVVCDLDRFKTINDTYGHQVGDTVIEAFSQLITESRPETAIAARLGGEEFAVILRNCDAAGARLYAENLRLAFESKALIAGQGPGSCTASFGVTDIAQDEHFKQAFARADGALYSAKRSGRNRVIVKSASSERELDGDTGADAADGHEVSAGRLSLSR